VDFLRLQRKTDLFIYSKLFFIGNSRLFWTGWGQIGEEASELILFRDRYILIKILKRDILYIY